MSEQPELGVGFGASGIAGGAPTAGPQLGFGFVALPSVESILEGLNKQQRDAVMAPADGTVVMIAGAGCGKTKTILKRGERLYLDAPGSIGILSFARSVKGELEERIAHQVHPLIAGHMKVWTSYAIARKVVFNNKKFLGLPAHADIIAAEWEITKFLKAEMANDSERSQQNQTPHYMADYNRFTEQQLKAIFRAEEKLSAEGISVLDIVQNKLSTEKALEVDKIFKSFKAIKILPFINLAKFILWARVTRLVHGKLMFRDLLPLAALLPVEAYKTFDFRHVFVDEAQDLSVDQHVVVQRLAEACDSITFVGDPGQCIFRFSGSRPDLFLDIPLRYPNTHVTYLETNYRSVESILDLANYIVANAIGSPIKLLPNGVRPGDPVEFFPAERDQLVEWVYARQRKFVPTKQMAILIRSNVQALDVEIALSRAGIPYNCLSGSFFQHPVVDDFMAYVRFVSGERNATDWGKIVGHVPFLGKKTAEEAWAMSKGDPLKLVGLPASCRAKSQQKNLVDLLDFLRRLDTDDSSYIGAIMAKLYKVWENRWPDDPEKLQDAMEVANAFEEWIEGRAGDVILDEIDNASEMDSNGVAISTVHKAKGLEWDYVALWGFGEGVFPKNWDSTDHEEEACIVYVAFSRPRLQLTIFRGKNRKKQELLELPYGLDKLFCEEGLLFAVKGTQNPCEACLNQLKCLARRTPLSA